MTAQLALDERDIRIRHTRAGGPGGQHVNKNETAVQLHFNLHGHRPLPPPVYERLRTLAGGRINNHGQLVIRSSRHRSQERNRREALQQLIALVARAARTPRPRRPSRPPRAAAERRLEDKHRRGLRKRLRSDPSPEG